MAFLTGQSRRLHKSFNTDVGTEQGLWRCFAEGLKQS